MQSNQQSVGLDALRDRLEVLRTQDELLAIEESLRTRQLMASEVVRESEWGELINRREYLTDSPGWQSDQRISLATDRRNGDNHPFWITEQEHATARGIARFLAGSDEIAIAALENLTNYTVGTGASFRVAPKEKKDTAAGALAGLCQRIIDGFLDQNDWCGEGDRECVRRVHRDGELFVVLKHRGGMDVEARLACPSFVTQPDAPHVLEDYLGLPPGLDWKYGVATDQNNTTRRHGYFVQWYGSDGDWEFVRPCHCVHERVNVDREVKRGMSDYYAVYVNLERSAKLLGNTVQGAAIQAAIAYIREHPAGTTGRAIDDFANRRATSRVTMPTQAGGTEVRRAKQIRAGTVVDVTNGTKFQAGPMGQPGRSALIEILQAALRMVGVRWTMPEYMISGDASNANFASTLVSESPFVKASESRQGRFKRTQTELAWKVLGICCQAGVIGAPLAVLKQLLSIAVEVPAIATRDRLKESQATEIDLRTGLVSRQTASTKAGYDYEEELAKGAAVAVPPPSPFGPPPNPPTPEPPPEPKPGEKPPLTEAEKEALIESLWRAYP